MSAEENKAIARRLYEAASAGGEYDEIADEVLAPDYVGHMPPYPDMHGPDGDKEFNARTLTILPDARIEIEDMVDEGDRVAVRWTLSGTHEGTTRMDVALTGKEVEASICDVLTLADGKIVERGCHVDFLGLMQQMGAMLAPE